MLYLNVLVRMKNVILILYLLFVIGCCNKEQETFTESHNLNFRLDKAGKLSKWTFNRSSSFIFNIDSSIIVNDKYPLIFTQQEFQGLRFPLKATMQQLVLLPENASDSADIFITCKSQNLNTARIVLPAINKNEEILFIDTLSVVGNNSWITHKKTISIKDIKFLQMKIEVSGVSGKDSMFFLIDKIRININNKNINEFPLPKMPCPPRIKTTDITPLSLSNSKLYDKIPELSTKKIIAIGETVHGSGTINKSVVQLIKHQVKNNNCKLIILEYPIEHMLSFNRFIQGDEAFKIDRLMRDFTYMFSVDQMKDLLMWLKEYNKTTKKKVWLLGMDFLIIDMNCNMFLFDYLFSINQYKQNESIDSLCMYLLNPQKSLTKSLELLSQSNDIISVLGENQFNIFSHCLTVSKDAGTSTIKRYLIRDRVMYDNTSFLLNLLSKNEETSIIYSHLGHSKYKPEINGEILKQTFGSLMKEKYAGDYSCIGLLIGNGDIVTTSDRNEGIIKTIDSPPQNSLEYVFSKTKFTYLYSPALKIKTPLMLIRHIGNTVFKDNFGIISLAANMDGCIFISESKASKMTLNKNINNSSTAIFKFKKNLDRYNQYKQKR